MDDLARRIESFLDAHHVMTLASAGEDGVHAASLLYARRGLVLYWTSAAATRHSRQLEAAARVSATVAPDCMDFRLIRGLQIAGRARRLETNDAAAARTLLVQRYRFLADLERAPVALREAFQSAGFYCLQPGRITLIDNTLGFGHRETLEIDVRNAGMQR